MPAVTVDLVACEHDAFGGCALMGRFAVYGCCCSGDVGAGRCWRGAEWMRTRQGDRSADEQADRCGLCRGRRSGLNRLPMSMAVSPDGR